MNFLSKMLSGEGEENPSSKRVITFLAFSFSTKIFFTKSSADKREKVLVNFLTSK